jgi:hypothetical protein
MGNFEEPIRISIFVKDLFAGFCMVSLLFRQLSGVDWLKYVIAQLEKRHS